MVEGGEDVEVELNDKVVVGGVQERAREVVVVDKVVVVGEREVERGRETEVGGIRE